MRTLGSEALGELVKECPSLSVLKQTPTLIGLMTTIRDKCTGTEDFVFYSDRIIRLLVEAGLDEVNYETKVVRTPTAVDYEGVGWSKTEAETICGVSIMRAGESMEAGLRNVCKGVSIGKILIQRDEATALPQLFYSKLPPTISEKTVLLLDPMLATGGSAITAVKVLTDAGVSPKNIIFINLICCPEGVRKMYEAYSEVRIITAAVDMCLNDQSYILPGLGDFGCRYFGTVA